MGGGLSGFSECVSITMLKRYVRMVVTFINEVYCVRLRMIVMIKKNSPHEEMIAFVNTITLWISPKQRNFSDV